MQVVTLLPGQGRRFQSVVPLSGSAYQFLLWHMPSAFLVWGQTSQWLECWGQGWTASHGEQWTLSLTPLPRRPCPGAASSLQQSGSQIKHRTANLNQMLKKQSIITLVYVCPKSITWNRLILKYYLLFVWNFGLGVLYICLLYLTIHLRAEYER